MPETERKFDLVLYGASGFTGAYILEELLRAEEGAGLRFAVAGRSEPKLRETLRKVGGFVDRDLSETPLLVASTDDAASLDALAARTRLIVSAVGPFRTHGEPLVRAAVRHGTHLVDISGEPAYQERVQLEFDAEAKRTGACVVPGCGWDSIPCDLGVLFLRRRFEGVVSHAESFVRFDNPAGYPINDGTFQTLLLSMAGRDRLGDTRRRLMPERPRHAAFRPPKRGLVWWERDLRAWAIPFPGADRSVVQRSQYHEATVNGKYPIALETYTLTTSWLSSVLVIAWFALLAVAVRVPPLLRFCQRHPDGVSFGAFSRHGPKREQVQKARFTYFVRGTGWPTDEPQFEQPPARALTVRCDGPDAGYVGTARCVLGAAFTILRDGQHLPKGGVFTPAVAFERTDVFERLAKLDVTFRVDESVGRAAA
ncbi:Sacchrp-dh-NADP domain-containing protein [Aphelenchoides fujianensis]|nr:Sacchrp-dh-NADP domain-containing protein [Aphelenchoides fujianensis]